MVTSVMKDLVMETVAGRVRWPERTALGCPQCGKACGVHDRLPDRTWRHLSAMQYTPELRCAVPRCDCPEPRVKAMRET
jgi:hypothetical protein